MAQDLGIVDPNWPWSSSSLFLAGWNGGCPLYGHVFRMHDPQDLVFASLALHTENIFPANYGRGVTDQFCSMTRFALEKDVKLDLLNTCGRRKNIPDLPSWVPDYTSTDPIILLSSDKRSSRKAFLEVLGPKFNGAQFTLNGFQLETIHALGKESPLECIPGSREFQQNLGGWERMAAELETNKRYMFWQKVLYHRWGKYGTRSCRGKNRRSSGVFSMWKYVVSISFCGWERERGNVGSEGFLLPV
ncbi:hypothetical protein B0J14DRAFT_303051 [Halenospora varia]|nr:hypothetical protein B0J14DRAFT_303051 [Halenospora varia]